MWRLASVVVVVLLHSSASFELFGVGVNVNAGVDEQTRAFIHGVLDVFRQEGAKVDARVVSVLEDLDRAMKGGGDIAGTVHASVQELQVLAKNLDARPFKEMLDDVVLALNSAKEMGQIGVGAIQKLEAAILKLPSPTRFAPALHPLRLSIARAHRAAVMTVLGVVAVLFFAGGFGLLWRSCGSPCAMAFTLGSTCLLLFGCISPTLLPVLPAMGTVAVPCLTVAAYSLCELKRAPVRQRPIWLLGFLISGTLLSAFVFVLPDVFPIISDPEPIFSACPLESMYPLRLLYAQPIFDNPALQSDPGNYRVAADEDTLRAIAKLPGPVSSTCAVGRMRCAKSSWLTSFLRWLVDEAVQESCPPLRFASADGLDPWSNEASAFAFNGSDLRVKREGSFVIMDSVGLNDNTSPIRRAFGPKFAVVLATLCNVITVHQRVTPQDSDWAALQAMSDAMGRFVNQLKGLSWPKLAFVVAGVADKTLTPSTYSDDAKLQANLKVLQTDRYHGATVAWVLSLWPAPLRYLLPQAEPDDIEFLDETSFIRTGLPSSTLFDYTRSVARDIDKLVRSNPKLYHDHDIDGATFAFLVRQLVDMVNDLPSFCIDPACVYSHLCGNEIERLLNPLGLAVGEQRTRITDPQVSAAQWRVQTGALHATQRAAIGPALARMSVESAVSCGMRWTAIVDQALFGLDQEFDHHRAVAWSATEWETCIGPPPQTRHRHHVCIELQTAKRMDSSDGLRRCRDFASNNPHPLTEHCDNWTYEWSILQVQPWNDCERNWQVACLRTDKQRADDRSCPAPKPSSRQVFQHPYVDLFGWAIACPGDGRDHDSIDIVTLRCSGQVIFSWQAPRANCNHGMRQGDLRSIPSQCINLSQCTATVTHAPNGNDDFHFNLEIGAYAGGAGGRQFGSIWTGLKLTKHSTTWSGQWGH